MMTIPTGIASTRTLTDIANAIRAKNGESRRYKPTEMGDIVAALDGAAEVEGAQYPYDADVTAGMLTMLPYTSVANALRGQNKAYKEYKPCDMAAAIRALTWERSEAYAVAIPGITDGRYELRFIRSASAPAVGDLYADKEIAYVYSGFEDRVFTSNSQLPWYPQHDSFEAVSFDDEVRPATCAYWFYMFRNCVSFNLTKLDTSRAVSLAYMFYYCSSVVNLFLYGKGGGNVESMKYMFYTCTSLQTLNVAAMDVSVVKDFAECFRGCSKLTAIAGLDTWSVSSACTTTAHMFNGCSKLPTLKLGAWDMSGVANASYMFQRLSVATEIDMSGLSWGSATANITNMFNGDGKLAVIYAAAGTDLSGAATKTDVFYNCYSLKGGAGSGLDNSTSLNKALVTGDYARVDGLGGKAGYFTAK